MDFVVPADHSKIERKQKSKYLGLAGELKKKNGEHESDGDTNCDWYKDWQLEDN